MPLDPDLFFTFAEKFTNTWGVFAIPGALIVAAASMRRRGVLVSLISIVAVWAFAKPITSAAVFAILFGSLAIAIVYSHHPPVQGFLTLVGVVVGLWLWNWIHFGLDWRHGYQNAMIATAAWAGACGSIAYLPML